MQTNIVKPHGPHNAKIAFIGEAPGAEEERLGMPFIGRSGQSLMKMMGNAGIRREDCYITNVVKERPPGNNIGHFIKFHGYNNTATETPAFTAYKQYLLNEELPKIEASVLVAIGNTALWALTGMQQIQKRRGSVYSIEIGGRRRKVIPIVHPAAALRQYLLTYTIQHDLHLVSREALCGDLPQLQREILLRPTFDAAMNYMDLCLDEHHSVGFDIEVVNQEVSCFALARSPQDVMCIPLHKDGKEYFSPMNEVEIWKRLAQILEHPDIQIVGQNIIFDASFMLRKHLIRTRNMRDTMIAQAILMPGFPKGLDFIVSMHTTEPYYKDEGKMHFKGIGDQTLFWAYNAKDAAVCMEALPRIEADIQRLGSMDTYIRQTALLDPLLYMQERGIRIDAEGIKLATIESSAEIATLEAEFRTACGVDVNPDSPKQLAHHFYVTRGFRAYTSRTTGNITTDEQALKRLSVKGSAEARILLKLRRLKKMHSTYLTMEYDKDGRIRTAFNPVGTVQGRLSSGKTIFGTGGNFQNMPPLFKRYLLADEGYLLFNIDLSQAENRVVAHVAPDRNMIAAFESGTDIHSLTASLIFGIPINEVSDVPGSSEIGSGEYSQRFWGKKANHGFNYDLGYRGFSKIYEIPTSDAKFIYDKYHRAYPGLAVYYRWIQDQLGKDRTITNCMGRRRKFFDRWGDGIFKEAYSYIPQSTVADKLNRDGLIYVYNNQMQFKHVELLNQVHDSIVFQIPISAGWDYMAVVIASIVDQLERPLHWRGREFVIPCDVKAGLNMKDLISVERDTDIKAVYEQLLENQHAV